jgi:anaerobic magnesium-protoporphyrin IX monomethyl ester cyclase
VRVALCCLDWDLMVCNAIKKAAPNVMLAVYGSIIPDIQRRVEKESFLDYILQGEPDETVYELAMGHRPERIAGLHMRRGETWVSNPSRPLIKDLDQLPFPKWERLPYQRYTLPKSSTTDPIPFLPMLTSRGCPFGCHYCPYPVSQGLPFRFRSPQNVVDEIEHLVKDLGIQYIIFRDPMFSLRQDRVVAICEEIQRRKLAIRWKCETRIDCLSEATLRAMVAAGCVGINFGIESAEVEIQANVGRKPITQQKILETVALCREIGLKTFCFFIIGLPGDTVETILASIGFAIRLQPSWVQFNAATPLIGTKLRTWAIEKGLITDEEYSYRTSHEGVIGNENLTKEQVAALQRFAVFFERYLMNRGGILKNEGRKDWPYKLARSVAHWGAGVLARTIFAIGRSYFERAYPLTVSPARVGAVQ